MAIKVTSIRAVLDTLNGKDKIGPWFEDSDNYFYIQSAILSSNLVTPSNSNVVALKMFFNSNTGETKFYVAKWVDDQASKLLP